MIVKEGQNLFDISMQEFGSVLNIFDIIEDNRLNLNFDISSGTKLEILNLSRGNEDVRKFMKSNNIEPAHKIDDYGTDYLAKYENDTLIMTEEGQFIIVT